MADAGYSGNVSLKRVGEEISFTEEQVNEILKCTQDPVYFVRNYVKIVNVDKGLVPFDLWDFQEDLLRSFHDNRFNIVKYPRQSGKSTTTIAFLLWSILFNEDYVTAILANKGSLARELLGRLQKAYENLPKWLQQGVITWNKGNIELENGSKVFAYATSASGVRGGSFNCVVGDTQITILDDYGCVFIDEIKNANSSKYTYNNKLKIWDTNYMYYTVYKITNKINGKIYIGYHQTNNLDDGYMGSGKLIIRAIEKYGIENFTKEYIEIFDNREEAEALEALLVNESFTLDRNTYNISLGGNVRVMVGENNPFFNKQHSDETIQYLSEINKNRNVKEEDDILIDDIRYHSFQHAKKQLNLTNGQLKNKMLEKGNGFVNVTFQKRLIEQVEEIENRKKQNRIATSIRTRQLFINTKKSEEFKRNISQKLKGRKKSEEHINKINKNPEKIKKTAEKHRGMKRTAEAKSKMSKAKKGKKPHNFGKVYCYNPITKEKMLCFKENVPNGWSLGFLPKENKNA